MLPIGKHAFVPTIFENVLQAAISNVPVII